MSERATRPVGRSKAISDDTYQYIGLVGFVVSGVFFLISGLSTGDPLTILGSLTWIFACLGWGVPLERSRRAGQASTDATERGPTDGSRSSPRPR